MKKAVVSLSLLSLLVVSGSAFACSKRAPETSDAEGTNFLSVQAPAVLAQQQLSVTDKEIVAEYIRQQLAANNIDARAFRALTAEQQRLVLTPGANLYISREARHAIIPLKNNVPYAVSKQIVVNNTLAKADIDRYGLAIPVSVQTNMSAVDRNIRRVLIGSDLVMINGQGQIVDVAKDILE